METIPRIDWPSVCGILTETGHYHRRTSPRSQSRRVGWRLLEQRPVGWQLPLPLGPKGNRNLRVVLAECAHREYHCHAGSGLSPHLGRPHRLEAVDSCHGEQSVPHWSTLCYITTDPNRDPNINVHGTPIATRCTALASESLKAWLPNPDHQV